MNFVYVYILQSLKDDQFYVGMTKDVALRLQRHNQGRVASTKSRVPFKLLFVEECKNYKEGRVREKYWKSGAGREKIARYLADLPLGKSKEADLPAGRRARQT